MLVPQLISSSEWQSTNATSVRSFTSSVHNQLNSRFFKGNALAIPVLRRTCGWNMGEWRTFCSMWPWFHFKPMTTHCTIRTHSGHMRDYGLDGLTSSTMASTDALNRATVNAWSSKLRVKSQNNLHHIVINSDNRKLIASLRTETANRHRQKCRLHVVALGW